ncbi:DUF1754-domain-containing protein [Lactarius indigo]|nr:DUF1754-domain-containing protein [Lactarius indigo]
MSDYDFRPGGSLKLKGVAEGGVVKKKKKPKSDQTAKGAIQDEEHSDDKKTAAEKRFQEVQRKRLADKVKKLAGKTHKDRVHEFNSKLEALSEHHDIPKMTRCKPGA